MSPKSLLRHPLVVSELEELTSGAFREVIEDEYAKPYTKVKRVLLCTGKVYYDLLARQQADKRKDIAILRIEQLHPFPLSQVKDILRKYKNASEFVWVQEEPENMGAWTYLMRTLYREQDIKLQVIARKASASPATGYYKMHNKEQAALVDKAFND